MNKCNIFKQHVIISVSPTHCHAIALDSSALGVSSSVNIGISVNSAACKQCVNNVRVKCCKLNLWSADTPPPQINTIGQHYVGPTEIWDVQGRLHTVDAFTLYYFSLWPLITLSGVKPILHPLTWSHGSNRAIVIGADCQQRFDLTLPNHCHSGECCKIWRLSRLLSNHLSWNHWLLYQLQAGGLPP